MFGVPIEAIRIMPNIWVAVGLLNNIYVKFVKSPRDYVPNRSGD